ncbi:MAG: SDR family NAD(P)-dependent oxidoreductase [Planctomycetes bacterium]|nr:SDR family NAD(P)-dependent oxidoreductase [Planctomycetota bacterium]
MTLMTGRTVFVTGASSGIGQACATAFAAAGARVLMCARRRARLEALTVQLRQNFDADVFAFDLDVQNRQNVADVLAGLPDEWQDIDILVNNAGLSRGLVPLQEGLIDDWEEMIDTNVKGLLYVSRSILPGMIERGSGHVINIGSIAGREVYPNGAAYCASKYAVTALTKGMRLDLNGSGVQVSTIDPGLVNTEFSSVRFHGDQARADSTYNGMTPLSGEDIAEAVLWVAARPAHVNIAEMLVLPVDQASATLVHRRP